MNRDANTVSVLLGTGTGSFGAKTDFPTGLAPVAVAVADLNGDGRPDLVVVNRDANTVSVLLNVAPTGGGGGGGGGEVAEVVIVLSPRRPSARLWSLRSSFSGSFGIITFSPTSLGALLSRCTIH